MTSVAPHFIIINRSHQKQAGHECERDKQADAIAGAVVIGILIILALFALAMNLYDHFRNK